LPRKPRYTLSPGQPTPGRSNLLRPPIASPVGTGILTCFPSATRFRLTLGADSPCVDERCAGNLGLTASGPFTRFIATHVSIRTSDTSRIPFRIPSLAYGTLSYRVSNPLKSPLRRSYSRLSTRSRAEALASAAAASRCLTFASRKLASSKRKERARAVSTATQDDLRWIAHTPSFGYRLEPRTSSAQDDSISELLRFL
jgi:hypothetical protein